jgi:uncharacterized protein with GYD domain
MRESAPSNFICTGPAPPVANAAACWYDQRTFRWTKFQLAVVGRSVDPSEVVTTHSIAPSQRKEITMHFCFTGQYTAQALTNMMDNPSTNRYEAAKALIEAAGGKLISMYATPAEGPGVLAIFDVPEPSSAGAICGVVVASGALHNVKLTRLLTQEEVMKVRQQAVKLRSAYRPPGK